MRNQYIQLWCQSISKWNGGQANTEYIEQREEKRNGRKRTETVSYLNGQILISETVHLMKFFKCIIK